ncbi:class I SAM-dependent methyltransferase [Azospirillum doebereinerae]
MRREFAYYDERSLSACAYDFIEDALSAAGKSVCHGDIDFYRGLAARFPGPVLDAGTGTGRVAWALAQDGHEVLGVDRSPAMLRLAELKRSGYPEPIAARVRFAQGDMTGLDLGRSFSLAVVAYYGFNHLLDPNHQRAALLSLHRHLMPDGRLVIHALEPTEGLALRGDVGPQVKRFQVGDPSKGQAAQWGMLERKTDLARQQVTHLIHYRITGTDGALVAESQETLIYRWGLQQELRYLFELCGFAVDALYGDFQGGEAGPGKQQIWLLRRV